jgi:hypothetical protein
MLLKIIGTLEVKINDLFLRLAKLLEHIPVHSISIYEPSQHTDETRIRLLEAKTEYLLTENYRLKSLLRRLPEATNLQNQLSQYQVSTFDYQ